MVLYNAVQYFAGILFFLVGFSAADIASEFTKANVVPDVINKAPTEEVEV